MKLLLPLLSCKLLFSGCDKDSEEIDWSPTLKIISVDGGSADVFLTYDNNNLAASIFSNYFHPNEQAKEFFITYYPSGKIKQLHTTDGYKILTEYENEKLIRAFHYQDDVEQGYMDYLQMAANELRTTYYEKVDQDKIPQYSIAFYSDNKGNIHEALRMEKTNVPNQLLRSENSLFLYDENHNPLYEHRDLLLLFNIVASPNNVLQEDRFDKLLQLIDRTKYSYQYNDYKFPISGTRTLTGPAPLSSPIQFVYKP